MSTPQQATKQLEVDTAPRVEPRSTSSPLAWVLQPAVSLIAIVACLIFTNKRELNSNEALLANDELAQMFGRHLLLTVVAALAAVAVAVPLGIALTRGPLRRYSNVILALAGFGQAAPAIGLVVICALILGIGIWPFILALVIYGILPIVANVVAGLGSVDQKLVEAARGMGMSAGATLSKVELPIAVPVMLAGVRTAIVLICGTASFGGFVGAGGLGALINTGIKVGGPPVLVVGGVLIAALALLLDWIARVIENAASPKGL